MRATLFVAVLGLAACGDDPAPVNEVAAEESAAQQVVPTNDTTAIDAVSGEASNMAEDVDFLNDANEADANAATANSE